MIPWELKALIISFVVWIVSFFAIQMTNVDGVKNPTLLFASWLLFLMVAFMGSTVAVVVFLLLTIAKA